MAKERATGDKIAAWVDPDARDMGDEDMAAFFAALMQVIDVVSERANQVLVEAFQVDVSRKVEMAPPLPPQIFGGSTFEFGSSSGSANAEMENQLLVPPPQGQGFEAWMDMQQQMVMAALPPPQGFASEMDMQQQMVMELPPAQGVAAGMDMHEMPPPPGFAAGMGMEPGAELPWGRTGPWPAQVFAAAPRHEALHLVPFPVYTIISSTKAPSSHEQHRSGTGLAPAAGKAAAQAHGREQQRPYSVSHRTLPSSPVDSPSVPACRRAPADQPHVQPYSSNAAASSAVPTTGKCLLCCTCTTSHV